MSALSNARLINRPPKHEPWHLQLVLKDRMRRRGRVGMLSEQDSEELLDASENAAFFMQVLEDCVSVHKGTSLSLSAFLNEFRNDCMMMEVRLGMVMA